MWLDERELRKVDILASGVAGGGVCVVSEEGRGSGGYGPRENFFIFLPKTIGVL